MFAGEIAHCVTQQVLLIVALVPKDLVAGFTQELQIRFLVLHLLEGRGTADRSFAFTTALAHRVLLHVLA